MKISLPYIVVLLGMASVCGGQTTNTISSGFWTTNRTQPAATRVSKSDDAVIGVIMSQFQNAIRLNDFTYAVQVMYLPYMEKMGGRDKAMRAAKAAPAQMKAQNLKFESWTALKPYTYATGKQHYYAIVRFEAVLNQAGKRTRLRSYLLGIRSPHTAWQFVNGDDLTAEDFAQFFPDFPQGMPLPVPAVIPM